MKKKSTSPRKLVDRQVPSGLESCWKLWRLCLCRNGFYPLAVAPFVTAAWLLDLYGTLGCNSLHLEVGMEPVNIAWNKTSMDMGLFHYRSDEIDEIDETIPFYMSALHPECRGYTSLFNDYFIDGDKTWKMSQYMAYISFSAGLLATITIWMMIVTPLPTCFFWPGILLPSSLVMLLAGGAKFLFFDTEICRSALWLPSPNDVGANPNPQKAEGCHLSDDSIINIVTCVLSFVCVLLICLRAPTRRNLDKNFGNPLFDVDNDMQELRVDTMEDSTCESYPQYDAESQKERAWSPGNKVDGSHKKAYDLEDIVELSMKNGGNEVVSTAVDTNSRFSLNKRSKRAGNKVSQGTWESEKLRVIEPSIEYDDKDLNKMMSHSQKWKKDANKDRENDAMSHPQSGKYSTPAFCGLGSQLSYVSPTAPSDEGAFFRSPLKAFKDNFSPQKVKKAEPPKQVKENKQYDDEIIQNCLNDLERSFSE